MRIRPSSNPDRGFTLVEVVVVIVLVGILAYVGANLIGNFIGGYVAASQRQELASAGRLGVERMTREVRRALPNSVRELNGQNQISFLRAAKGGRYRAVGPPESRLITHPGNTGDESFVAYGLSGLDADAHQLVVYPIETAALYADLGVTQSGPRARIQDAGGAVGHGPRTILLETGDDFARHSPQRRIQAIDQVVSFCYLGPPDNAVYMALGPIASGSNTIPDTSCDSGDHLLVQPVTDARFTYSEGALTRAGIVRLYIEVGKPGGEESVDFLQEVQVRNVP